MIKGLKNFRKNRQYLQKSVHSKCPIISANFPIYISTTYNYLISLSESIDVAWNYWFTTAPPGALKLYFHAKT